MSIDWHEMFAFSLNPLELMIRGTAIYWFLLFVFRTFLQRDMGAVGVADVLVLVLVADAAQNAMAGEYRSIGDGIVLVSTILGWNVLFDYLAFRSPRLRKLLQPPVLRLVHEGRLLPRNLRREYLTVDELMAKLREHGITDLADVHAAFMESDGNITVIKKEQDTETAPGSGGYRDRIR
ncbi:hypothetical protein dqs_1960 [Azoarcus olearius]|uniref:DUF421 domain-containing protein n=1 Tax=Azoarcus sp. (strain BH72) TaxID=418699 RepID=UPI0008060FA0|nr:YetF domain-containing protein [Azoarcus olearius]ANQ84998.1 hypothetical protein dqs_1960 [Azoarcus olearius]